MAPEKKKGIDADHQPPYNGEKAIIRVRKTYSSGIREGQVMDPEDTLALVILELFNIAQFPYFIRVYKRAINGNLPRKEWIEENTKIEFRTIKSMKRFFERIWKPWCSKENFPIKDNSLFEGYAKRMPNSYNEWKDMDYPDKHTYLKYWADYYDNKILPYLKKVKEYNKQKKKYFR